MNGTRKVEAKDLACLSHESFNLDQIDGLGGALADLGLKERAAFQVVIRMILEERDKGYRSRTLQRKCKARLRRYTEQEPDVWLPLLKLFLVLYPVLEDKEDCE
jgi:hypothetical protein